MHGRWVVVLASFALLAGCGVDEPRTCESTLEGDWNLVGYADHGVSATASGEARFESDGSFAILGEVTFPDEPVDTLDISGTWSMSADRVTLTTADGTGDWLVEFSGADATLTLVGPLPTNVIQLRRPSF